MYQRRTFGNPQSVGFLDSLLVLSILKSTHVGSLACKVNCKQYEH